MFLNLKTAKALGVTVSKSRCNPSSLLLKRGQIEPASCYWVGGIPLNTSFCIPAVVCAR